MEAMISYPEDQTQQAGTRSVHDPTEEVTVWHGNAESINQS
jgi:hypothetical protein